MTERIALPKGTVVPLPAFPCVVEEVCGMGSSAIVYKASYEDDIISEARHEVLLKELYPREEWICRGEDNCLSVKAYARELWETYKKRHVEGNRIHIELLKRNPSEMIGNIMTSEVNQTLVTLFPYQGGRTLYRACGTETSLRQICGWMLSLLDTLSAFHEASYVHLDISPGNILIVPRGSHEDALLLDYSTVSLLREELGEEERSKISVTPGFSAPELMYGERGVIGFAADYYSVGAVFFWCLTGRPLDLQERLFPLTLSLRSYPLLTGLSEEEYKQVLRILYLSLSTMTQKRYKTIQAIRGDFEKLLALTEG